jgi:mannosyl-glycoprotein endo-beta-N-acetylglucosaminidase
MPLRGQGHSKLVQDETPFFSSLADLDVWAAKCSKKLTGLVEYQPRSQVQDLPSEGRGKLLVNGIDLFIKLC